MDYINIKDMQFYGYHGVLAAETAIGQLFRVSVKLGLDLQPSGVTDDLTKTVNYAEVYALCKEIVEGEPFKLIEALAEGLAAHILADFPLVKGVEIELIKPDPPIAGHYKEVSVQITRGEMR